MDKNFYQDDELEQFLQDEVKQHRMYPSDHIWKNIRTEIHGYRAWPALTFISLFIVTALTITTLLNNHPDHQLTPLAAATITKNTTANATAAKTTDAPVAENNYFENIAPAQLTAQTFANLNEEALIFVARNSSNDEAAVPVKAFNANDRTNLADKIVFRAPLMAVADHAPLQNTFVGTETLVAANITETPALTIPQEPIAATVAEQSKKTELHANADDFLKDFDYVRSAPKPRNTKFGFQFYVTPSNSYRRLSDEKVKEVIQPAATAISSAAGSNTNIPLSAGNSADVNNVVRHKPAMGFELGFALIYNMSPRFKFKTGLQLNVRQYYIETFQSTNDLTSLSLINYRGVETISFYSPYNNNTGYRKTRLDNKIYQLSVPLGFQWDALQGKRFGITAEASVQPTLTLNNNTYLLSTDYKHYTGGNDFIRKWNINTSVGVNLTYKRGASSWQIGPQVRYQHLPTYSNLYPIKEYLMDYGVRIGYTRQIK